MTNAANVATGHDGLYLAHTDEVEMTAPREKSVDAERLSFNLPTVAIIVATAFAVGGMQYVVGGADRQAQAQMQSDIRDIGTRTSKDAELTAAYSKLQEERGDNMKSAIDEMRKRIDLLQIQYGQLRETMLTQSNRR